MGNYVVIPTYKEMENLKVLLPRLKKYNVVIVDDDSNDGTDVVCKRFSNVRLIVRKNKRGLASAVRDGVLAIKDAKARVVVADADFEHDYSSIDKFFKLLAKYDFVEGVKRGKRLKSRAPISFVAKRLLYTMVPESAWLKDPMSGFFGFRKDKVEWEKLRPIGYKIMLEVFMNLKGGSRKTHLEYPYGRRVRGKSKLKLRVLLEFLIQIYRLNRFRLIEFTGIGAAGIFISEGLLYLFHGVTTLSFALLYSIVISTVINFLLNHYITFSARRNIFGSLVRFGVVTIFSGMINYGIALGLSGFMLYLWANFIGIVIAFAFKYIMSEWFVWGLRYAEQKVR